MKNLTVDESEENRKFSEIGIFLDFFEVFIEAFEEVSEMGIDILSDCERISQYEVDNGIFYE